MPMSRSTDCLVSTLSRSDALVAQKHYWRIRRLGLCIVLLQCLALEAQQPDARTTVAAMQEITAEVIEKNASSVVAIARVRKVDADDGDVVPLPFDLRRLRSSATDPEFIPDAFGAGVVVDENGLIVTALHVLGPLCVEPEAVVQS